MNRKVFMERLRECLADISAEEREDALTYYESYFEEAGVENEAQVIEELGSPEKVAENIKRDLLEEPQSSIQAPECMKKESSEDFSSEDFEKNEQYEEYEQKDKSGRIAMIIVIAVLTFPIWITVAATLFGLIVAAVGVLFGCAAGGIAATVGLLISGVALIGMGIGGCISGSIAAGILVTGAGFFVMAIGILLLICVVWICGRAVPACCRWIVNLCRKPWQRRKERMS